MIVYWFDFPYKRQDPNEIQHAIAGDYRFSLCRTYGVVDSPHAEDEFLYRVWVYYTKGWHHVGAYNSIGEARIGVLQWSDPDDKKAHEPNLGTHLRSSVAH